MSARVPFSMKASAASSSSSSSSSSSTPFGSSSFKPRTSFVNKKSSHHNDDDDGKRQHSDDAIAARDAVHKKRYKLIYGDFMKQESKQDGGKETKPTPTTHRAKRPLEASPPASASSRTVCTIDDDDDGDDDDDDDCKISSHTSSRRISMADTKSNDAKRQKVNTISAAKQSTLLATKPSSFKSSASASSPVAASSSSSSSSVPATPPRDNSFSLLPPLPVSPASPASPSASSSSSFVRRSVRSKPKELGSDPHPSAARSMMGHISAVTLGTDMHNLLQNQYPAVGSDVTLTLSHVENKGLCVTAGVFIPAFSLVIEYAGTLLTMDESAQMEDVYAQNENMGCFMFYFRFRRKLYCIDSTRPGKGEAPGSTLVQHTKMAEYERQRKVEELKEAKRIKAEALKAEAEGQEVIITKVKNGRSSLSPSFAPSSSSSSSASPSSSSSSSSSSSPSAPPSPSSSSSSSPRRVDPSQPRSETLGYGYARYINHSRSPNLSVKLIDCTSTSIMTDAFDGEKMANIRKREQLAKDTLRRFRSSEDIAAQADLAVELDRRAKLPEVCRSSVMIDLYATYPRLCFFSNRNIARDEELTIDYGDRDKESAKDFPWLNDS